MHGAATALFAIVAHEMSEKQAESAAAQYQFKPQLFAPGLALAIVIHSGFNHFPDQPLAIMAVMLLLAPMTLFVALSKSDHATQAWLTADAAAHRQALEDIRAGRFQESEAGRALMQTAAPLKHVKTEDVLAWAELKTALILRAEELILASHAGADAQAGAQELEQFSKLDAIEKTLGATIVAALSSKLGFSRNDFYELGRLRAHVRTLKPAAPPT
jgi:hypothetical protein